MEFTPLFDVFLSGQIDRLKQFLLENPESVKETDEYGLTILHDVALEASEENLDMIRLLLDSGADVNAVSDEGGTPIYNAATPEVVDLLVEYGANINWQDVRGATPLHTLSAEPDTLEVIQALVRHGARLDIKDHKGNLPMDIALYRDEPEIAEILRP